MQSLLEFQEAFGEALLREPPTELVRLLADGEFTGRERLDVYRNSCRSTLASALRLAYPAIARLVGTEFFDYAAEQFVLANPPTSAYLNDYGAQFADFLAAFPPAAGLAYLPDVARFEWVLAHAANVEDTPALALDALAGIQASASTGLRFIPHPSVRMLWLRYPADDLCDAVMSGDEAAMHEVDLASGPARLVIHRGPQGVEAQRLDATDYAVLGALCAGEEWSCLVEKAPERAAGLLAEQVIKGRLAGFRLEQVAGGRS